MTDPLIETVAYLVANDDVTRADLAEALATHVVGRMKAEAEIERLRDALRDILQAERWNEEAFRKGCDLERAITIELMSDTVRIARAALGETVHD